MAYRPVTRAGQPLPRSRSKGVRSRESWARAPIVRRRFRHRRVPRLRGRLGHRLRLRGGRAAERARADDDTGVPLRFPRAREEPAADRAGPRPGSAAAHGPAPSPRASETGRRRPPRRPTAPPRAAAASPGTQAARGPAGRGRRPARPTGGEAADPGCVRARRDLRGLAAGQPGVDHLPQGVRSLSLTPMELHFRADIPWQSGDRTPTAPCTDRVQALMGARPAAVPACCAVVRVGRLLTLDLVEGPESWVWRARCAVLVRWPGTVD